MEPADKEKYRIDGQELRTMLCLILLEVEHQAMASVLRSFSYSLYILLFDGGILVKNETFWKWEEQLNSDEPYCHNSERTKRGMMVHAILIMFMPMASYTIILIS